VTNTFGPLVLICRFTGRGQSTGDTSPRIATT
jgi:hypothetical protein